MFKAVELDALPFSGPYTHENHKHMQVLLTGSERGQLFWELQRTKPEAVSFCVPKARLDIADAALVERFVRENKPDVIINAAAYTAVDAAETEKEAAFAINDTAVGNLATAAKASGAHLIHVSTDFVFGRTEPTPIKPETDANPVSVYGQSKLAGERRLFSILPDNSLLFRTAWVYSSHGSNFVKTMLRLMKERAEVGVIADQVGTPTWAHSLANAIWRGAQIRASGVLHWTDAGVASWYDFAQAIMEEGMALGLLDSPATVRPLRTDQYPTPAARPKYSILELTGTWETLDLQAAHWRVELRKMMRELT